VLKIEEPENETRPAGTWAFLTNHAHVLLCIARDPRSRARDIARQIGITERATQRILADLIADGYVKRTKVGRRNHYTIDLGGHLRHPVFRDLSVGPLLEVLNRDGQPQPRPTPRPGRRP
jgi:DNA-binding Lrp family transcriptional regulator